MKTVSFNEADTNPTSNGMYVAYIEPDVPVPWAAKKLLMFIDGRWGYPGSSENYRGTVYAWIGPLPGVRLS